MNTLETIAGKIAKCRLCSLCNGRINTVPGEGNPNSEVLFIGEGPGKDEDMQGRPFVGRAGKILEELLASINMRREDIFIANVVKCRPPGNRDPQPEEVEACWAYLRAQITLIAPLLVVTLGRHSTDRFLPGLKISQVHGQPKRYKGIATKSQIYLPLYHPAVALYSPSSKAVLFEDFKKIPLILKKIKSLDQ